MDNNTTVISGYNVSNVLSPCDDTLDKAQKELYLYVSTLLILFCLISIVANAIILLSVCWIRKRLSPTLHISLSLAAADTFTLFMFASGLFANSLLPKVMCITMSDCYLLWMESFRLGGILTTLLHLLALAVNHYLGIQSPLQYPSYMTRKNIQYCVFLMWTIPWLSLVAYIHFVEAGFSTKSCSIDFIKKTKFRTRFSSIFFTSVVIMIFIYSHIYYLVRQHQRPEFEFEYPNAGNSHAINRIAANEKAIITTLLIVGSVIIGWMPAVTAFFLLCDDCLVSTKWGKGNVRFTIFATVNLLMILKNASNSYIYAYRMKEIKLAIRSMKNQILGSCRGDDEMLHGANNENAFSRSWRDRRTVVCRLQSYPDGHRLLRSHSTAPIRRFSSNKSRRRNDNFSTSL